MAWLFALVNRHCEVYAFTCDDDDMALLSNMVNTPQNLHFLKEGDVGLPKYDKEITLDDE